MFLAPPEVNQRIIDITGKLEHELNGLDVIAWSLEQSYLNIERCQALRVMQGLGFH